MKFHTNHTEQSRRPRHKWALSAVIFAGLAVLALAPVAGEGLLQMATPPQPPHAIYPTPEAKGLGEGNQDQTRPQSFEAANAERKKEIADDSSKLLKLATDLKAEVDKSTKDELSLSVIRKADAIEKLAHDVKEKMKLTVGPS